MKKNEFISENPTINNNIFLYVRNDIDDLEEKLKTTKKRIIISTNLGGRGTDIKTSIEEEKNGGLHVIITKLSSNSRTQKQAFGRTSRQGNKGSGQYIITKKKELKTYEQLINERARKEKEMIDNINLDVLLLKDELFEEYVHCLRKYPELNQRKGNNTKDEIDERWSFFLKKNFNDKVEHEEIRKNFKRFKTEINKIMRLPRYERFNNDFLRITDAFNTDENEEVSYEDLYKYLILENVKNAFIFRLHI
jgi:superfamily II DNA/RNA helicase